MGWQGWVGIGLAVVFVIQVVDRVVGSMRRLAEERREALEAQLDRLISFAEEVVEWIPSRPHDPALLQRLKESLGQLRRLQKPELRYQEAAFLEVVLERLMEDLSHAQKQDGETLLWVQRWEGLLHLLNETEIRYQEAVEAYHRRLNVPGVNMVAGILGYTRMPEFALAGAVEEAFARAMEQAEEDHGGTERKLL